MTQRGSGILRPGPPKLIIKKVNHVPSADRVSLQTPPFEVSNAILIYLKRSIKDQQFTLDKQISFTLYGIDRTLKIVNALIDGKHIPKSKPFLIDKNTEIQFASSVSQQNHHSLSNTVSVSLANIRGHDTVIGQIKSTLIRSLSDPQQFIKYGVKPPRGLILYGPPGTGKTLLARATASETKSRLIALTGTDLVVGLDETHSRENVDDVVIRKTFETAMIHQPSIIFLDELDMICPANINASTHEKGSRLVRVLCDQLDQIPDQARIVVLAATNNYDRIHPFLKRRGRLDRSVEVGIPGEKERAEMLTTLLSDPHDLQAQSHFRQSDEIVRFVASRTHGYVAADLEALCQQACLIHLGSLTKQQNLDSDAAEVSIAPNQSELSRSDLTTHDFSLALNSVLPTALRDVAVEIPSVQWSDIGGQAEVKERIKEVVEWPLFHAASFSRLGIRPPKGILLFGPPGCSKTMIARAIASSRNLNFLSVKGPELFSKWVGDSEKAIAALFRKARSVAPCVIFFDEVDSIAGRRGGMAEDINEESSDSDAESESEEQTESTIAMFSSLAISSPFGPTSQNNPFLSQQQTTPQALPSKSSQSSGPSNKRKKRRKQKKAEGGSGGSSVTDRVLSQLLTEIDGIASSIASVASPLSSVIVIAATNRPDVLDPAFLRPGRIDRLLYVAPPNDQGRREIVERRIRKVDEQTDRQVNDGRIPVGPDVQIEEIVRLSDGFSGAEMVAVCREASLCALREFTKSTPDQEHPNTVHYVCQRHFEQAILSVQPQITPTMLAFFQNYISQHADRVL